MVISRGSSDIGRSYSQDDWSSNNKLEMMARVKGELPHIIESSSRGGVLSSKRSRDQVLVDLLEYLEMEEGLQGHMKEKECNNNQPKTPSQG
ncbi:hypothetical protein EJB05_13888, partial [Eragrostis curvula]